MAQAKGPFKERMVPRFAVKTLGIVIPSLLPAAEQEQILSQVVARCLLGCLVVGKSQAMAIGAHGCRNAALLVQADSKVEPGDRFIGVNL